MSGTDDTSNIWWNMKNFGSLSEFEFVFKTWFKPKSTIKIS